MFPSSKFKSERTADGRTYLTLYPLHTLPFLTDPSAILETQNPGIASFEQLDRRFLELLNSGRVCRAKHYS